jgi:hypothetical protein
MQALIYHKKDVMETLNIIQEFFKKENFVFEEKDRIYLIVREDQKISKNLNKIKFWARNSMLKDFPPNFSLTIEGEIREDNGTIIEVEFKEYHGSREHVFAGTLTLEKYFNLFCEIFNTK